MTIGSDQLDEWGKTLIACDELYRELQLLVRINPEAYRVDDDTIAAVGAANADAWDDGGMIHPLVFAKQWAWHLAGEARSIPPVTSNWVTLIRYIAANLHYLDGEDREFFTNDLRWLRGSLGAWVNENRLAQGEAEDRQALNARRAREELRERVTQINQPLTREELHVIFPELVEEHWHRLRRRKQTNPEGLGRGTFWPSWVAEVVLSGDPDLIIGGYANSEYEDVYDNLRRVVSYEALRDSLINAAA